MISICEVQNQWKRLSQVPTLNGRASVLFEARGNSVKFIF